jgi:hypothetical protein
MGPPKRLVAAAGQLFLNPAFFYMLLTIEGGSSRPVKYLHVPMTVFHLCLHGGYGNMSQYL